MNLIIPSSHYLSLSITYNTPKSVPSHNSSTLSRSIQHIHTLNHIIHFTSTPFPPC
ncbi:hypothetical protein HanRHA438_Chr02g0066321 [Helianthus annuus]|uniref:Uncharacterized protein n=1 Tax=Helianthus annuus TaxID=4232 RepID=A0A251VGB3_HELAN|nr:hypothetical protein HanXRQr2_Chr02g0065021 [Helianthus annuus]KAJ0939881.1 hypothetical protein HanRHA438_Chr02g0066321 [Helianthus annuus]